MSIGHDYGSYRSKSRIVVKFQSRVISSQSNTMLSLDHTLGILCKDSLGFFQPSSFGAFDRGVWQLSLHIAHQSLQEPWQGVHS